MSQYAIFWLSLAVSGIAARPILLLLARAKARQTIDPYAPESHRKKAGTPTMGGLIILVGLLGGLVGALSAGDPSRRSFAASAILLLAGFGIIGFVDDHVVPRIWKGKRGLGWRQKILLQIAAAGAGLLPLVGPNVGALAAGTFVVLFCANGYNFADGLDGLAGSIALAYAGGLVGLASIAGHYGVGAVGFALAGATIPFLLLNAHPARIMMGDVGSLPIGALLGLATVALAKAEAVPPLALFALNGMIAAELLPVPIQVFWFKRTGKRLFPATPIHHGFEKRGWPETRIVPLFVAAQIVLTVLALTLADGRR